MSATRSRPLVRLAALLGATFATAACSEEAVSIFRHDADAGDTAHDGSAVDGGDATCAPSRACMPNGNACAASADCCSLRCEGGACLEPGSCAGPGVACTSRASCCSGRCEPVPNTTSRACLDYCGADGASCTRALDCCSLACNGGACGGVACRKRGDACATNGECCAGVCSTVDQKCALDAVAVCRATGEDCNSGGGAACCATCDTQNNRCDFGPGPCRPNGAFCSQDTDCCRGACAPPTNGVRVCTAACLTDGVGCASAADCCSARCGGTPATCGVPVPTCTLVGSACAANAECCSTHCLANKCANGCASN